MSVTMPTVGDRVIYHTTQDDKDQMQGHGNVADVLPAIVVASWGGDSVNLKVMTDGAGPDLWDTSAIKSQGERGWEWQGHYEYRMIDVAPE